jgi:hypothetical protein
MGDQNCLEVPADQWRNPNLVSLLEEHLLAELWQEVEM